jgi:hypothetical protein
MITLIELFNLELANRENLPDTFNEFMALDLTKCRSQTLCEIIDLLENVAYIHVDHIEENCEADSN